MCKCERFFFISTTASKKSGREQKRTRVNGTGIKGKKWSCCMFVCVCVWHSEREKIQSEKKYVPRTLSRNIKRTWICYDSIRKQILRCCCHRKLPPPPSSSSSPRVCSSICRNVRFNNKEKNESLNRAVLNCNGSDSISFGTLTHLYVAGKKIESAVLFSIQCNIIFFLLSCASATVVWLVCVCVCIFSDVRTINSESN